MPNANGNDTQEMLWQVESELRQIHAQIASINATIKPWQVELADLRAYHKQLEDLQESLQRRSIKPRIVTCERRTATRAVIDPATRELMDIFKTMTPAEMAKLCQMVLEQNGETAENPVIETLED